MDAPWTHYRYEVACGGSQKIVMEEHAPQTNSPTRRFRFVYTGPGTTAGRYLRNFWQPVYESDRLAPGCAVPIRLMGEDFTLYRGASGTTHMLDFRCPHRQTQLSTGWVEGDDIRCFFHGWRFNAAGQCVEQPAEPKPFCRKVTIRNYPTQEQLGLIFCYLGKLPAPGLPQWPEFAAAPSVASMAAISCNYFQSAENIVDDAHVGFAHRAAPEIGSSARGLDPPRVAVAETSYGLSIGYTNRWGTEYNHFIMPNMCYLSYVLSHPQPGSVRERMKMRTLFWYVPIDDHNHLHVMVTCGNPLILRRMKEENQALQSVADNIACILAGKADFHKAIGPEGRKPHLIRIQDGVTIVGQGSIADRSQEHLGASDAAVVSLRKIWSRELRLLDAGKPLTPYARPDTLPP
jgi:5,5'-dehydrodivanillate O-demethylase